MVDVLTYSFKEYKKNNNNDKKSSLARRRFENK